MPDDTPPIRSEESKGGATESPLPKLLFLLSLTGSIFLYGVAVGVYRIFPYELLDYLHDSAVEVLSDREMLSGTRPTQFIQPARHDGEGVTKWTRERARPGWTLVSGFFDDANELRLLDMDGTVRSRWPLRYSALWPSPDHVDPPSRVPTTDWHVDVEGSLLLPDGSVAFNFAGLGLTKLDPCGGVEWQLARMTHHSLEPSLSGGFWVPAVEYVDTAGPNPHPPLIPPYMDHLLLEVTLEGRVVREISLLDVFFENHLQALLLANGAQAVATRQEDPLHLNDVEALFPSLAGAFPMFSEGDLLLSMRDLNLLMVVDPDDREVKWYRTGPWIRQHDPDFRPDGTISVYNNNTDDAGGRIFGGSNLMVVDPATHEVTVAYGAEADQWFYSSVRGKHQNLPAGNVLLTEQEAGRFFEVDPTGTTVWEYVNRYGLEEVAEVTQAIRYPYDYLEREISPCS